MRDSKKDAIGVHHGARQIDESFLIHIIPGLQDLKKTIDNFREVAYKYNHNTNKSKYYKENFNNNISILAERGMGKSSAIITIINQIENNKFFSNQKTDGFGIKYDRSTNKTDIINPMIDPEDINYNSSILGWAMISLFQQMDSLIENVKEEMNLCQFMSEQDSLEKQLLSKKRELVDYYSIYNDEYSDVALNQSINKHTFKKNLYEILSYDYKLKTCFFEFIDLLVSYKRRYNNNLSDLKNEPLIYFFFDDVDVSSQKSIKILTDILSYFAHPNIVVFITGDYDVFEQSLMTYFMDETKEITLKFSDKRKEKEIQFAKDRAEYFLKKVLPTSYRYYIQEFSNDSAKINYNYHSIYHGILEEKNIFELLSYVFFSGFHKEYKDGQKELYLKTFLVPQTFDNFKKNENDIFMLNKNALTEKVEGINLSFLYAYLSVFSVNTRGFMNVYNYLLKEANVIFHGNYHYENIQNYWHINKFEEFLNVLITSKHTFLKYENQIRRFLYIKSQDPYKKTEESKANYFHTKLRIDCEELELFIDSMMKKIDRYYQKNSSDNIYSKEEDCNYIKNEITSIIMLSIMVNELFYCVYNEHYYQRYMRIQEKLKNILTNVFVNSLNQNIKIMPTHLGLRRTLCVFYSILSRMSIESLKKLDTYYEEGYNSANNKKYIVQLYFATIQLATAGIDINTIDKNKGVLDEAYKSSTYSDIETRQDYETIISKNMKNIFKYLDREWLADKIKFATAIMPDIRKIEYSVYSGFLEKLNSTPDIENQLNQMYNFICYTDNPTIKIYFDRLNHFFNRIESAPNEKLYEDVLYHYVEKIRVQFNDINTFLKKSSNLNDANSKMNKIVNEFETQVMQRMYNSPIKKSNQKFSKPVSVLLNLLDDFKTEYEVAIDRLSYLDDTSNHISDILYSKFESYFNIELWDLNEKYDELIDELILEINFDCLSRNFEKLRRHIKVIVDIYINNEFLSENFNEARVQTAIDSIAYSLLRATKFQERVSRQEMTSILKTLNKYIQCYYMYIFILEYVRVMNLTNTKFFNIFKEGIDFTNREKNYYVK